MHIYDDTWLPDLAKFYQINLSGEHPLSPSCPYQLFLDSAGKGYCSSLGPFVSYSSKKFYWLKKKVSIDKFQVDES